MSQFAKKLIAEWRRLKLPKENETVIVAISGGADSVSLLAALHELQTTKKLNLKIVGAHFNHKLRGVESDSDAEFVKNLTEKFGFIFEIQNPKSKIQNQKGNLEQAARQARYKFLFEIAEKFNAFAVLTAHTLDDQAETFLLRLIRGSGADGLGAIKSVRSAECGVRSERDLEKLNFVSDEQRSTKGNSALRTPHSALLLVRPLLSWAKREMTESYCRESGIEFRHDTMNDDEKFSRVRVRKQLIPFLKTFNPNIVETLANTADLLRDDAEELARNAERGMRNAELLSEDGSSLLAERCKQFAPAIRRRILRNWLELQRGDLRRIDAKHIRAIETLIMKPVGGRTIELTGGEMVTRRDGKLVFARKG